MLIHKRLFPVTLLLIGALLLTACKSVEERAEEHYENAVALAAEGDVDRAIVELRNALELNSSHIDARRSMAEFYFERGNLRRAYRQYLRLAEKYPDDLDSRIMLAELAFAAADWEELNRHGEYAQQLAPDEPRVRSIALLRDYRASVDEDDAATRREIARTVKETLAEQPESVLLRNIILDNAVREQKYSSALEQSDWLIANDPTNESYYKDRLRILATLGDMSAIEEQLIQLIEVFPDEVSHKATLIRFYVGRNELDKAEAFMRGLVQAAPPEEQGLRVDLIRFLIQHRDNETARAEIAKAISESPDPLPFQVIEASLDFSSGNSAKAIASLQSILDTSEELEQEHDIKITLAKMLLAGGNEVGSRTNVEEVLVEDVTHPEALKMQAAWQIEADNTDAAISGLRTVLDQNPQDATALTLIARAYERAGQPELARDSLAQAVEASGNAPAETVRYARLLIREERYLPAEDILLAALRLAPSNTDILVVLGQLYLQMEDFGRVEGVGNSLRRTGVESAIQAANAIEAERLNLQRGVDDAMAYLEGLASNAEANLAAKLALFRAKVATGDSEGALSLAEELKKEDPDSQAQNVILAVAYIANGQLELAEGLYREVLDNQPMQSGVWRALSRLKLRQGDRDEAKATIDQGLVHMPEDADLLWAKASFQEQDGEIENAISVYEMLYEMNSNSIVVANNLASLLATYREDQESLDRAWTIARRLRDSEAPALQDTYGWLLHRRGNSAEALPYLEAAAKGLPTDALVQYHLGQALMGMDRPQDALQQFRKAVEIAGPADNRPQIDEARALIVSLQEEEAPED